MDGDNSLMPPFSFQRLLFEDDWHRWDTYSTVDANVVSPDPPAEMYHDTQTMMAEYLRAHNWTYGNCIETPEEYLLQRRSSTNEQSETASQEEYHQDIFTLEELGFTEEDREYFSTTGLNVEVIDENIRRMKYENCSDETKKCVICLCKLKYSEEVSKLECGHDFHFGCIKNWLMVKNECPLCKQKGV